MGICDAVAVSQIWKSSDHEKCLYVQINVGFCRATKLSIMSFVLFDKDDNVVFVFKKVNFYVQNSFDLWQYKKHSCILVYVAMKLCARPCF